MLDEKQMEEAKLNAIGKKILTFSGIGFGVFSIIALASNADFAWAALIAAAVGVACGIGMSVVFRSKDRIIKDNLESQKKAAAMVSQIVSNNYDTSFLYEDTKKKNSGTKEIVKDAVIGGVIAGPAGAVVGAIAGKNKVDNEKNEKSGTATTKDIVKGAVVGGIVAGPAGAVVGAIAGKEKADKNE